MYKKIESELISIAHEILKMKQGDDVNVLLEKARVLYEKLSVLAFIENTSNELIHMSEEGKQELKTLQETVLQEQPVEVQQEIKEVKQEVSKSVEAKVEQQPEPVKEEVVAPTNGLDQLDEFKEAVSLDEVEDLFQKVSSKPVVEEKVVEAVKEEPVVEVPEFEEPEVTEDVFQKVVEESKPEPVVQEVVEAPIPVEETKVVEEVKQPVQTFTEKPAKSGVSLNDRINQQSIQVGLNDRLAFVKYLFNDSQEDFNRVISQLNTITTETEAKAFIKDFVKPDYNWDGKEEYEERLVNLIERKFL